MSFAHILAAQKAKAAATAAFRATTDIGLCEPAIEKAVNKVAALEASGPLYYWTRGKEQVAASVKPGFGWKQGALVPVDAVAAPIAIEHRAVLEDALAKLQAVEAVQAPKPTVKESYWINRTNGEFALSAIKPGFVWRAATDAEALELAGVVEDIEEGPALYEGSSEEALAEAGYTLNNITAAFEAARFTREEALEETALIADLIAKDPGLAVVMAESSVPLNAGQLQAAYYAKQGKSFVLTGAAGTGKTTAQAATIDILDKEAAFSTHDFKYIGEAPSIAVVAFTKVAVRNIQKAIRKNPRISHYSAHCMTIHALLEFEPVKEERRHEETGALYEVRIFRPKRTAANPLTLTHLVIEEASMVGLDLFRLLADAILPGIQIIYLGDINQLQPVFSKPILAYALVKLPVIELTRVYRQALDNPIIANAHRVLKGFPIETSADGRVSIVTGSSTVKVGQSKMALAIKGQFKMLFEKGFYDPEEDQILLPWNKQELGTKSINEAVASFLGAARNAVVQQVKAGRHSWWLAIGDKVLVDKRVGLITQIADNPKYIGSAPAPAGFYTRDGTPILGKGSAVDFGAEHDPESIDYSDFSVSDIELEEGARAASHIVTVQWMDTDGIYEDLRTAGDFADSKFDFAYAMTVHKAQGSEYRKVFIAIHQDHLGFLSREWMYTGLTRAREEFIIFAKTELVAAACLKQEIKGTSLQDKIEYFVGGALQDLDQIEVEFPLLTGGPHG